MEIDPNLIVLGKLLYNSSSMTSKNNSVKLSNVEPL